MFIENYRQENAESMAGGEAAPIPYRRISPADWQVWSCLLPFRSHVMDQVGALNTSPEFLYLAHGVPYEISTEIRRAAAYFDKVEIWRARQVDKDPIVVGMHADERYLVARWGFEKLIPFDTLKKNMPLVLAWKHLTSPLTVGGLAALGLLAWGYLM